jgi:hypothetical protein
MRKQPLSKTYDAAENIVRVVRNKIGESIGKARRRTVIRACNRMESLGIFVRQHV